MNVERPPKTQSTGETSARRDDVPKHIAMPTRVTAAGNKPKLIDEYIAVCLPAFLPDTVHREGDA